MLYLYQSADLGERFWKENGIKHAENNGSDARLRSGTRLGYNRTGETIKQSVSELSRPE